MAQQQHRCRDCDTGMDRRRFIHMVGGAAIAASAAPLLGRVPAAHAAPTAESAAETTVKRLYETLSDTQKEAICFSFDDKRRHEISANWHISKPLIGDDFYSAQQRQLIDEVLRGVTSEEGHELLHRQMKADAKNGINSYSVAIFGEPGTGKFQWEMTGRHLTIRADGDSVENVAFGGPIVYGHGVGNPKRNLFYHQTKAANEVFKSLDAKQAKQALLDEAPIEDAVALQGADGRFEGIAVADLSSDQKQLVQATFKTLLAPYRQEDVDEVTAILDASGGFDKLHMAFYREDDLEKDEIWDIWRVEGPSVVWHFRGAPHVHAYINIGVKAS